MNKIPSGIRWNNRCFFWTAAGVLAALLAWAGPASQADAEDPVFAQFHQWAIQPAGQAQRQLVSQGVILAKARQAALKTLAQQDPAAALKLVESHVVRQSLPADVVGFMEERVSGLANIRVIRDGASQSGQSADGLVREVELNGRVYPAVVYGQRLSWQDYAGIPVQGIVVDGLLVLAESPVRVLEAGEIPPAAQPAGQIAADIGGEIKFFATPAEVSLAERKLMFPTGLRLNPERNRQAVARSKKVVRVYPNELAWQRINEQRQQQGLPPLSKEELGVRSLGSEIEIGTGPARASLGVTPQIAGSADNSKLSTFPPIGNQLSQGSCAAFSTTYYVMTHMAAMVNGWNVSTGDTSRIFSPKWTYNMVNGGGDNGSWPDEEFTVGRDLGLATWAEFPYTGSSGDVLAWCTSSNVWRNAINRRMNDYTTLDMSTTNGLNQLKALLDNGYVVAFATGAPAPYSAWVNGTITRDLNDLSTSNLVGQVICKYVQSSSEGHGMTVVGYNDHIWCDLNGNGKVDPGEKGALKIANQWGTSGWPCNAGYIWLSYDALWQTSAVPGYNPTPNKVPAFEYGAANCVYLTTARTNYTPQMLAAVTVNTANRGSLYMYVGKDDPTVTHDPATQWMPQAFGWFGDGNYNFSGGTSPQDSTFWVDLTDLNPDPCLMERYFVGMYSAGIATLKAYTLLDNTTSNSVMVTLAKNPTQFNPSNGLVSNDYSTAWAFVNRSFTLNPSFSATPTTGAVPLFVTFTDLSSGAITNRFWQFGDGSTTNTTGTTVTHTYSSAGSNSVQLTVTSTNCSVAASVPNAIIASCRYSFAPGNSTNFPATASTGAVFLNVTGGCSWTATNNVDWLAITSGASGTGTSLVSYAATDNSGNCVARNGTLTIGGLTYTVTQAAGSGVHSISSSTIAADMFGGSTNLTVYANCNWTATNNVSWITLTGPTSGTGTATVNFTVGDNSAYCNPRTGMVTVAGLTCKVIQATGNGTYAITPGSASVAAAGLTNGSVAVNASSGCAWTASSSATSWLKVTGGSSGVGTGIVSYSVSSNLSNCAPRSGTLTIAGLTFNVDQAAGTAAFSILPASVSVGATGTTATVAVIAGSGCPWSATNGVSWLTIIGGSSGTGSGTVSYAVDDNSSTCVNRSGTLTIAGKIFTVTQASGAGTYAISPTNSSVGVDATTGSVTVTPTGANCPWAASSSASWLTITSAPSGTGPGSVTYAVDSNISNCVSRTATLTIASKTFTLTQAAGTGSFSLPVTNTTVAAGFSSNSVAVLAGNGCPWTATSGAGWLTILSGSSGSGNGTVVFSAASNTNTCSPRTGTLTIGGQTYTVTQNGGTGVFVLSPTSTTVTVGGTNGIIKVISTGMANCPWSISNAVSWITITGQNVTGTGTDTVSYMVAPNTGSCASRNGTLTIGGKSFTVNQSAGSGSYTISPTNAVAGVDTTNGVIAVNAGNGCVWTAFRNVSWLTITAGASGTSSGLVYFTVQSNLSNCTGRVGTMTIGGQTFTVTQLAGVGSWGVAPTNISVAARATTGSLAVTAGAGCPWSASANVDWITVTATNGVSSGSLGYIVQSNLSNCLARTGTLTVAGQTVSITQAAGTGTYTLAPTSQTVGMTGTNASVGVGTSDACGWTATSAATWINITSGTSGTGSGIVTYVVQDNTSNCTARSSALTIAGKSFSVSQAAGVGSYSIAPTNAILIANATTNSVVVTATSTCSWSVSNAASWVTISSGASGNGNGTVTYRTLPNTTTNARTAFLTIAKQSFVVTQLGNIPPTVTIVPVTPVTWPTATVPLSASVSDDGAPLGQLTARWSKLAGPGSVVFGSSNAVNTTVTVSTNGTYLLVLAASDGVAVSTASVAVVVNALPGAPSVAQTGKGLTLGGLPIVAVDEAVHFAAEGAGLNCAWTFGDGSSSSDCNPSHIFTNCGPHNVTLALSDGTVTTVSNQTVIVACDLTIHELKLNLNFARQTATCIANAALTLPATFNVSNQVLVLDVGGAQMTFVLNGKGRGVSAEGVCRLTYRKVTGDWLLTANLVGDQSWLTAWSEIGLVNETIRSPGNLVPLPVRLLVNTDAAIGITNLNYTAVGGKTGQAR